jgi:signal transduction histidine kinase
LIIIYRSEEEKRQKIAFLMQREALNKVKNEFILQVGHELRNFVSAIIGLSEIIKEDLKNKKSLDNEIVKEEIDHLDHINDISQELMSFVTDLVDLNKMEDGKFEVNRLAIKTDFEDMVDRSIRILKSKISSKNIIINTNFADNLIPIPNLDQRRIKQILVSIIGNAIKYSSKDSKVDIFVKNLDQKCIEIIIKDFGIGMDESEIKTALATYNFAEYVANNETDYIELKLPLVRFLVEKQNGTMEIKSAKNYGTEVKIVF